MLTRTDLAALGLLALLGGLAACSEAPGAGLDGVPSPSEDAGAPASPDAAPPNRAPALTSSTQQPVFEGEALVYAASADDPDGDRLTFFIDGGPDAARFGIHAATGEVRPQLPLDFEAPADADGDNVYELTIGVRDPAGAEDRLALELLVLNVDRITFDVLHPPRGAWLGLRQGPLRVVVDVIDEEDGDVGDVDVSIAGQPAQSDPDRPRRWSAVLQPPHDARIALSAELPDGASFRETHEVRASGLLTRDTGWSDLAWEGNVVRILHQLQRVIAEVDVATGEIIATTDLADGAGPPLRTPTAFFAGPGDSTFVADDSLDAIVRIDGATNQRTILTQSGAQSGPAFTRPVDVVWDEVRGELRLAASSTTGDDLVILAVGPETGERTQLASTSRRFLSFPERATLDPRQRRVFLHGLAWSGSGYVAQVRTLDLDTGDIRRLIESSDGVPPPSVGTLSSDSRTLWLTAGDVIVNSRYARVVGCCLLSVDVETGTHRVVDVDARGTLRGLALAGGAAPDEAVVVEDAGAHLVLHRIDLALGGSEPLSQFEVGSGSRPWAESSLAAGPSAGDLYSVSVSYPDEAADEPAATVFAVDPETGHRTVVSGPAPRADGREGSPIVGAGGVAASSDGSMLYIADGETSPLIAVDRATGDQRRLEGEGPVTLLPVDVALSPHDRRAYVADASTFGPGIKAVELASGRRTVVSQRGTGEGLAFRRLQAVTAGRSATELLALDRPLDDSEDQQWRLFAVDVGTGDRELLYSSSFDGADLEVPQDLAYSARREQIFVAGFRARNDDAAGAADITGMLLAFDAESLARRVLDRERGPTATFYMGLAEDPDLDRLFLVDFYSGVQVFDLVTGERVLLAN